MSEKSEAARVVAKILARRTTPLSEVPSVIEHVQRALMDLGKSAAIAEEPTITVERVKARAPRRKPKAVPAPAPAPAEPVAESKAASPTLVRRADAITVAPAAAPLPAPIAPSGAIRGLVQWFDSRTGQGTLRLPGFSRDVTVDAAVLARSGITRLFKGQEIEATLDGSETPRVVAIQLTNATPNAAVSSGILRDRHAKTVVVELKRETQRRNAARAEAELLLPPRRAR